MEPYTEPYVGSTGPDTTALLPEEPVHTHDAHFLEETEETFESPGEFLAAPEPEPIVHIRPPELHAAPAELKALAPRPLGPPGGWTPPTEDTATGNAEFTPPLEETSEVIATPLPESHVESIDVPADDAYAGIAGATHAQPEALTPEEAAAALPEGFILPESAAWPETPVPVEPERPAVRTKTSANRAPRSLTSPHSLHHPQSATLGSQAANRSSRHHLSSSATRTARHTAQVKPAPAPVPVKAAIPAPQRMVPAWLLVFIGVLVGAIAAFLLIVVTPLGQKIGLMKQSDANHFALEMLKAERAQVQMMLNDFHRRAKIKLEEDMREFRAEQGRKAPEKMTLEEFQEVKKMEEEEDAAAAEAEEREKEQEKADAPTP